MPAVASVGKVHREIHMSAQGLETGGVKRSDRTHVADYRPDRQVLIAASGSLGHYPFNKKSPDAPAAETISNDDWFDLSAGPAIKQAGKTDDPAIEIGHPGRHSFWLGQVVVERAPGIVASGRRVFVDPPVMLGQLHHSIRQAE
jgi:hypothetical protein